MWLKGTHFIITLTQSSLRASSLLLTRDKNRAEQKVSPEAGVPKEGTTWQKVGGCVVYTSGACRGMHDVYGAGHKVYPEAGVPEEGTMWQVVVGCTLEQCAKGGWAVVWLGCRCCVLAQEDGYAKGW